MLVGLIAELIFRHKLPVFLGTVDAETWPLLCLELETKNVDYLSFEVRDEDVSSGFLVFATCPFQARPAKRLAQIFGIRGNSAIMQDGPKASGMLMGAAAVAGVKMIASQNWSKLLVME
jgi:hypothetical protein